MPEKNPHNNKAIDDNIVNKTDEKEQPENSQPSQVQKMRHIMQNFFNNGPTKWLDKEFRDEKKKCTEQNKAGMSRYAKNISQMDLSIVKENDKTQKNVNVNYRDRYRHQPLGNEQLKQGDSHPFRKLLIDVAKFEELNRNTNNNTVGNNDIEIEAALEKDKRTGSKPNIAEKSIIVMKRKVPALKFGCSGSQNLEMVPTQQIHRRRSEPPISRISSSNITIPRPSSENLSWKREGFSEKNLATAQTLQLHPGSVIILGEMDMNVKLTEYKPDVSIAVRTVSEAHHNSATMSGGVVVQEEFADKFKVPNYYVDEPAIFNVTSADMNAVNRKLPSEIFVTERYFSGGAVTDNSTHGVCLPEIFSLIPNIPDSPPAQRHRSNSERVNYFGFESDVSADFLSNTLAASEVNSSDSDDVFSIQTLDNDVASLTITDVTQDMVGASESGLSRLHGRKDKASSSALNGESKSNNRNGQSISAGPSDSSNKSTHESTAYGL